MSKADDIEKTKEQIAIMQAFVEGAEIECLEEGGRAWFMKSMPRWIWGTKQYRIKQTKPSIDWSHVAAKYKWLVVDAEGDGWLWAEYPKLGNCMWGNLNDDFDTAGGFASFKPGTCGWKDSLVERPVVVKSCDNCLFCGECNQMIHCTFHNYPNWRPKQ